jgi:VWFA-related protein
MRKFVFICNLTFFFSFVCSLCFGQTLPAPRSTVSPEEDIVKISTTLVQVDVTVTDKNGKIIKDLKSEEFEIFENGEKKAISNFSFVSSDAQPVLASKSNVKNSLPNSPIKPEQVRRTIALVVDDLTITYERFTYVKKSLRKFVDEQMQEGDFVAIARTGGSIGILEQFTSNRRQLHAAIDKLRWNPLGLGGPKFNAPSGGGITEGDSIGLRDPDKEADDFRQSSIASNMIGGINYIISGMKKLPGRKSAIIFSEGFKFIKRDITGPERDFRVNAVLEKLFDTAARSSVVVNTIDVRGLDPDSKGAGDDQQDGLIRLAEQTGGVAFINNNDFNLGIEKILNSQKGYYLIGYEPNANTFDSARRRFNKYTVKVTRQGATVHYRNGFFAIESAETANQSNQSASERLKAALTSPFAVNGIALNLNTLFGNDSEQGSYVRSLLHINAKDLQFSDEAAGLKKAVFDVLALSFNEEGLQIDKIVKNYVLTLPTKEYERMQTSGFVYYFTFPFKKPGAYQLRVAIRDKQSERIGSASQFVEIPNLKKVGLTLSGIVLENLTLDQWQRQAQTSQNNTNLEKIESQKANDSLTDASLKRFKSDTVLSYGFEVYNAKLIAAQKPHLTTQINVWRNGKLILAGTPKTIDLTEQKDWRKVASTGAFVLGSEMPVGDYVLQIIVTDNLVKGKDKFTEQFVQFEIV